jgi:hypothetical protein
MLSSQTVVAPIDTLSIEIPSPDDWWLVYVGRDIEDGILSDDEALELIENTQ